MPFLARVRGKYPTIRGCAPFSKRPKPPRTVTTLLALSLARAPVDPPPPPRFKPDVHFRTPGFESGPDVLDRLFAFRAKNSISHEQCAPSTKSATCVRPIASGTDDGGLRLLRCAHRDRRSPRHARHRAAPDITSRFGQAPAQPAGAAVWKSNLRWNRARDRWHRSLDRMIGAVPV